MMDHAWSSEPRHVVAWMGMEILRVLRLVVMHLN